MTTTNWDEANDDQTSNGGAVRSSDMARRSTDNSGAPNQNGVGGAGVGGVKQCCDKPRGFVGGVCDFCGGTVMPEETDTPRTDAEVKSAYAKGEPLSYRLLILCRRMERELNQYKAAHERIAVSSEPLQELRNIANADFAGMRKDFGDDADR